MSIRSTLQERLHIPVRWVSALLKLELPFSKGRLLLLLLSTDVVFIFLHLLNRLDKLTGWLPSVRPDYFSISFDQGMGESFQYVKEIWICILFLRTACRRLQRCFLVWSLLFVYLLLDDMFCIHERSAYGIAHFFGLAGDQVLCASLRVHNIGETVFSAFVGAVFVSIIGIAYLRCDAGTRRIFHTLLALMGIMVFFGVGIDLIARLFESQVLKGLFDSIEDVGEMFAMSLLLWYAYVVSDILPEADGEAG